MKGRRRARRTALQALYELDLAGHDMSEVLVARLADFYHAGAVGALASRDWPLAEALSAGWPLGDFDEADLVALGTRLGADRERVDGVAEFVRHWAPHARYCRELVRGVWANRTRLDDVIARIAPEWPVTQMAPVDRNVLRIALWEIATRTVPTRVAINEAVELARAFSGEGSRRMVNGALGTYAAGDAQLTLDPTDRDAHPEDGEPA
jgi:transcription antitermination factor NusB